MSAIERFLITVLRLFVEIFSNPLRASFVDIPTDSFEESEKPHAYQVNGRVQLHNDLQLAPRRQRRVSPHFKLIFLAILALTILSGIAQIVMAAAWVQPTDMQQSAFGAMDSTWKAGVGALLGLLGGKTA